MPLKLETFRLATPEEVEKIASESDLTATSRVLRFADVTAVQRVANEVDPIHFGASTDGAKYRFFFALKNFLLGYGANEFYFNVPADDEAYNQLIEHLGAQRMSKVPEFRYKVQL